MRTSMTVNESAQNINYNNYDRCWETITIVVGKDIFSTARSMSEVMRWDLQGHGHYNSTLMHKPVG